MQAQTIKTIIPPLVTGTSANRAPNGTAAHTYFRGSFLVIPSEMTDLPPNTVITHLGFSLGTGASSAVAGNIKLYLQNTADVSWTKGVGPTWATAIAGMTLVYDGPLTIPNTATVFDALLSTPFAHTGGGVYFAYDWQTTGTAATTGAIYNSNTTLPTGNLYHSSSTTAAPTSIATSSAFRPVMSVGYPKPILDANVREVYTMGQVAVPSGNPQTITALIRNQGLDTLTYYPVTLAITGANTFNNVQTITQLAPDSQVLVSFPAISPTIIGTNTVTVSVPVDSNNTNNVKVRTLNTNINTLTYNQGSASAGGVGFNTTTGELVGKFRISTPEVLSNVKLTFNSAGQNSKMAVWSAHPVTGLPDTLIHSSAQFTAVAGVNTISIIPGISLAAGTYYIGARQLVATNLGMGYQIENPLRTGVFYTRTPLFDTANAIWGDMGGSTFRLMIEPVFEIGTDVGIHSVVAGSLGTTLVGQPTNIRAVVKNYGTLAKNNIPVYYNVNNGTPIGPINTAISLNQNDTISVLFTGVNAFIATSPGIHTIKVFTVLSGDFAKANDTVTILINAIPQISTFPYSMNFTNPVGWTINQTVNLWKYGLAVGATNLTGDTAAFANFYDISAGSGLFVSPVFNISNLANSKFRFDVAYAPYSASENDSLQILVSLDSGKTFIPGSPALYLKSNLSIPSLATKVAQTTSFVPSLATHWRADTVDLSQFSTSTSLMVAFKGYSQYGNNCWVDNFLLYGTILPPTLTTATVTSISQNTATSGGNITSNGGGIVTERGVCWSTTANPTILGNKTIDGSGSGVFVSNLTGLTSSTLYYVRAYATNSAGTSYGNEVTFTTTAATLPILTTTAISSITPTTANSGGTITADGGAPITARGVCWSTTANPTIAGSKTTDGTGIGTFVSNISGLTGGTLYYVRAYATNSAGTNYGNEVSFTTTTSATVPVLTTATATAITTTTATSGGDVTADGGASVTARGVCWSTSANPTIAGSKTIDGAGTGVFVSSITGLTPTTLYYVRAYATNSVGTAYGNQITFTTATPIVLPTLTTTAASAITMTTANSGGNVTNDGNGTITARGVCWATSPSPTIAGNKTADGTGTGVFTSNITGLSQSTLYYARAYATNSAGTAYGNEITFTTLSPTVPVLTTTAISVITINTANSGGNVSSNGGASVTARGVCWGTTTAPTIAGDKTTDGTGTGSFTSNITGLTHSTTYYVRAYATNSVGTAYGNELSFTTLTLSVPTLTTIIVTSITKHTAVCGGNITADGNASVTARGVCWDTVAVPTLADAFTVDGTGTGLFSSNITGLLADETYYVRAYATNLAGTQYGGQRSFLTLGVGIDELTNDGKVNIYLSGEFLMIDFATTEKQDAQVSILDMTGRNIVTYQLKDQYGISAIQLPELAAGIYAVRILNDSKVFSKQFYISK